MSEPMRPTETDDVFDFCVDVAAEITSMDGQTYHLADLLETALRAVVRDELRREREEKAIKWLEGPEADKAIARALRKLRRETP